jgi:hypothetical protein
LLDGFRQRIHVSGIYAFFRVEKCSDRNWARVRVCRGDHYRRGVNARPYLNSRTHSFDEVTGQRQQVHTNQSDDGFSVRQHQRVCEQIIVDSLRHTSPGGEAGQGRTDRRGYTDFAESSG